MELTTFQTLAKPCADWVSEMTERKRGLVRCQVQYAMIRTVLADDEVLARQKLRQLLKEIEDVDIVGECSTAYETVELVKLVSPELLFLDICMPDMDGFDALNALSSNKHGALPQIVFVTANDQWAVRAFEFHALDYLLKPFTIERLSAAVQRARERLALKDAVGCGDLQNSGQGLYTTRMVFKSRGRVLFLSIEDIRWFEAEENYVRIHTAGESHLLRETIGHLESRLDPRSFIRIHRSSIVNLQYVKEVKREANGDASVVLTGGEKIALSRSYRSRIQRLVKV
jgi:two-component system LytT family response regulator